MEYTAFHCAAWTVTRGVKASVPSIAAVHKLDSGRVNFIAVSLRRRKSPKFEASSAPRSDRETVANWMRNFARSYFDKHKPPLCDKHTFKT